MDIKYCYAEMCKDCFLHMGCKDYFAVNNELWKRYSDHPRDMLCFNCFEIRIGRELVLNDFKEEHMAFTNKILMGNSPQEWRYNHYISWKAARKLGTTLISEEDFLDLVK